MYMFMEIIHFMVEANVKKQNILYQRISGSIFLNGKIRGKIIRVYRKTMFRFPYFQH